MTGIRALSAQTRSALIVSVRDARAVAVGIALPVVLLVLFNSIFSSGAVGTNLTGKAVPTRSYYLAGIAAYAICMQSFVWVIVSLTAQREMGHLKRLQGTPAPAWTFIGSIVLRSLSFSVAMIVVLFAIGAIAFGVHLRAGGLIGIAVYTVLGTVAMTVLGVAVASFMPNADVAASAGPLTALVLSFASGIFIPTSQLPDWLNSVGHVFPLYHLADGLQRSVVSQSGTGLYWNDLFLLLVWCVGTAIIGVRRFRWASSD